MPKLLVVTHSLIDSGFKRTACQTGALRTFLAQSRSKVQFPLCSAHLHYCRSCSAEVDFEASAVSFPFRFIRVINVVGQLHPCSPVCWLLQHTSATAERVLYHA